MFSRFHTLICVLSMCALSLCGTFPAYAAGNTGNVTGYVVDSTGAAITSASVSSGTKSAATGSSGQYTLSGLSTGTQTIKAAAPFFLSNSVTVGVVRDKTVTAPNIVLTANYGSISGTITDGATLAPIAKATVSIGGTTLSTLSDAYGHYAFARAPVGTDTLNVTASGYKSAASTLSVTNGSSLTVNFVLSSAVVLGPGSTIPWNGSNSYLLGTNYAWQNYGTDFGTGGWGKYTNWTQIGTDFAAMHTQGVHVVRWWVFADGRYSPEFNTDGTVSGLDSQFLLDIDQALQIAAANHIYLLFTMMDGGMWNNASFSGSVQMGGHAALLTNAAVQQTYLDNALKPLLQHVASSTYRSSVLGYDIVNEPDFAVKELNNGTFALAQVQSFVQNCTSYIHQYGGGGYATMGSAKSWWVGSWKGLGLDFYQFHWYPPFGDGALPTYASLNLDKPCIIGEFPTAAASFGIGDTNTTSAQWYLDTIYNQGYAGALGWGYENMDAQCNWASFQPVFTNWANTHSTYIGPK